MEVWLLNFTIDTTNPSLTLISPTNGTTTTNNYMDFTFNASDANFLAPDGACDCG